MSSPTKKYNPTEYWKEAGKTYFQNFKSNNTYLTQEVSILGYLDTLIERRHNMPYETPAFNTVLEVGCGFGRITKIITDTFIINRYVALDISSHQISHVELNHPEDEDVADLEIVVADFMDYYPNRQFDLVIAVEFLMHQRPSEVQDIVNHMIELSRKHVVSLDYYSKEKVELEPHNFNHDYFSLYGRNVTMKKIGQQALFHYKK